MSTGLSKFTGGDTLHAGLVVTRAEACEGARRCSRKSWAGFVAVGDVVAVAVAVAAVVVVVAVVAAAAAAAVVVVAVVVQ